MINLLPQEEKDALRREYFRRVVAAAGLVAVAAVLAGVILLLPSYFFLNLKNKALFAYIESSEKAAESARINALESQLINISAKINILKNGQEPQPALSVVMSDIIAKKPDSVKIDSFFYKEEDDKSLPRVSLQGSASRRDDLLSFVKALENEPDFKSVISPTTNLLKEQDLRFSLVIELEPILNE